MHPHNQTILAIDPGTRELGYALMKGTELLESGVLTIRHLPPKLRFTYVGTALRRWIKASGPSVLVLEHTPNRPADSGVGLPSLGRLLRRIARANDMDVSTYSAKAVRRTILNNGWAGKSELVEPLVGRHPQLRVYRGQNRKWKERYWHNMFDAIALGHHYLSIHQPPSRSR